MPRFTNAPTELVPLTEWPRNNHWIYDRITFLIDLRENAYHLFEPPYCDDMDLYIERWKNSFAKEYQTLKEKYPNHFYLADTDYSQRWIKELIERLQEGHNASA
jgi:hypothetical protein